MRKPISRQFHKVSPDVWRSKRFLALSDEQRLLWFYFASSPHQTSAGCCKLPAAYAVADLGWIMDQYLDCLAALVGADLIAHDPDTDEIYVCRWFKTSPPTNGKHAAGIYSHLCKIESLAVAERVDQEFAETEFGQIYVTNPSIAKDAPF